MLSGRKLFGTCFFLLSTSAALAAPSFIKESGVALSSATPQAVTGSYPSARLYFLRDFEIRSATSADGLTWSEESGIRVSTSSTPSLGISSITACTLLNLTAGGFRMLYAAGDATSTYRIVSATSSDGFNWSNDAGTRVQATSSTTFVGSPRLTKLTNGDWRLFYLQDINGGNDAADRQVFTSLSTDQGLTWSSGALAFAAQAGEIGISSRTDQTLRLFYTAPVSAGAANTRILSALSSDANGTSFTAESGVRVSTDGSGDLLFPVPVRSTESFRWRLYYTFRVAGSTQIGTVFSALTSTPEVAGVSPSSVLRTSGSTPFALTGEVFSPSPRVTLTKFGETDLTATSVSRTDDQTITAVFDINNPPIGLWSVVVTNSDGQSSRLSNAVTITFASGQVTILDNLIRPRLGTQTQIDISIFDAGPTQVKIYTLDGKLVKTLLEGDRSIGSFTVFWNGKTEAGHTVASGTYLLQITGPKLDVLKKIVVVK